MKRKMLLILMVFAIAVPSYAQRTVKGQGLISLEGSYPLGVRITYGQYSNIGYWSASAGGFTHETALPLATEGDKQKEVQDQPAVEGNMTYLQARAQGEYMFRIVGSRNRVLNIYGGAGCFLGAEFDDPFKKLPDMEFAKGKTRFLFGFNPKLEMEIFLGGRFAFIMYGQAPIPILSSYKKVLFEGGAGFRWNLR